MPNASKESSSSRFTHCLSMGPSSGKHCTVDITDWPGTALLKTLIETHFCLTCMVGGRDAEATLKSSFPNGYLIFRSLYTNSVPISTCLVHRYMFTADFHSCLPEESSVSFLMLTALLRIVLYVLVLLLF